MTYSQGSSVANKLGTGIKDLKLKVIDTQTHEDIEKMWTSCIKQSNVEEKPEKG